MYSSRNLQILCLPDAAAPVLKPKKFTLNMLEDPDYKGDDFKVIKFTGVKR